MSGKDWGKSYNSHEDMGQSLKATFCGDIPQGTATEISPSGGTSQAVEGPKFKKKILLKDAKLQDHREGTLLSLQ